MSMRQLKISKSITTREAPSLEKYFSDISKVDMVSAEEEATLAQRIRRGDQSAVERLTKANLRFVVSVAKQYQFQGLSLSDLINEGNMGLIRAAKKFDETKGFRFISYAVWWIRQSIMQALADQSRIVRIPLNKVGLTSKVSKAAQQLEQNFEREPTAEEISEYLDLDLDEVSSTMSFNSRHVSIDSPIGEDGDGTMIDIMENENVDAVDGESQKESMMYEIELALNSLPPKQQKVLKSLYGIGMDRPLGMEDIGEEMGLTRERVRQIRDQALITLRRNNSATRLKTYL
jgi:RNA polymerase primary sigma factor